MENNKTGLQMVEEHGCPTPVDASGRPYTCKERTSVLTYREQDVLQEIRRVQEEAAAIKRRLQEMDQSGVTDAAEKAQWERRLEELRARRNALEKEREEAAQERMRLLGHS